MRWTNTSVVPFWSTCRGAAHLGQFWNLGKCVGVIDLRDFGVSLLSIFGCVGSYPRRVGPTQVLWRAKSFSRAGPGLGQRHRIDRGRLPRNFGR